MNKKDLSYILRKAITDQQKVITSSRLIKPFHVVEELCTWEEKDYRIKNIKVVNDIDVLLKTIIDDLNSYNFNINGTTRELNEMLYKLKELSKVPEYLPLVEEFLKEHPAYVAIIYPELEDNI